MLEILVIAIAGSVIAGLWDLKTTEVPDEVPALMIVLALFVWFTRSMLLGDAAFFYSLAVGSIVLGIGLLMYYKKQWGAADAWIFGAIAYLIPFFPAGHFFLVDFVPNFLVVSLVYMIAYVLVLGIRDPRLFSLFAVEARKKKAIVAGVPAAFVVFVLALSVLIVNAGLAFNPFPLVLSVLLVAFLSSFWIYARVIEKYAFRRKITSSQLKVGDVLEKMMWRGLTAEEVAAIRKKETFVTIKEGVRFVPVFPITLVVTLLFGNLLVLVF